MGGRGCDAASTACVCSGAAAAGACSQEPTPTPEAGIPSNPDATLVEADASISPPIADGSMPLEPESTEPGIVLAEPMDEAATIYDDAVLRTYEVEITPADLATVDSNPSAEQYVPARLTVDGASYDVGYRYKGSIGAFQPPCSGGGLMGGGPKTGKCSVKLSFDWMDPEARFHGLKKLQFHAMNNDPSMLRERLGYGLFRAMGVPAARATHAILRVNGQADIYALVEEIDGRFTRSRFSEGGEGNLYKEIWPVHDDPQVYLDALATNENEDASAERVLRFKDAIAKGPDAAAAFMDPEITSSYMAVDRVIMNDDGAFHFYCIEQGAGNNPTLPGNHNYYWYEAEHAERLWIIPWDLDHSMNDSGQLPHIANDWRSTPSETGCASCGGAFDGPAPGCDPVIQSFQAWQTGYDEKIDAFIAGPFSKAAIDTKIDRWQQQLSDAGFAPEAFAVDALKSILDRARTNRGYPY